MALNKAQGWRMKSRQKSERSSSKNSTTLNFFDFLCTPFYTKLFYHFHALPYVCIIAAIPLLASLPKVPSMPIATRGRRRKEEDVCHSPAGMTCVSCLNIHHHFDFLLLALLSLYQIPDRRVQLHI